MTDEELRDALTWLHDNREELKLSADMIERIESLLNWLFISDRAHQIISKIYEEQKGKFNEKV